MPETKSPEPALGVMVLDDNVERAALVEKSLLEQGIRVISLLSTASGLLNQIEKHRPDVIVIDLESPDRDILESLSIVSSHNPTPIVMFSEQGDSDFINDAVRAGVTAYQGHGLRPDLVKPIIEIAMNQFRSFERLRRELADSRTELEEKRLIEHAKVLLASHRSIDGSAAYALMRKLSMDNNKRLAEVAETVVATLQNADEEADAN